MGRGSGGLAVCTKNRNTEIIDISPWWIFVRSALPNTPAIIETVYFKPDLQLEPILESLQILLDEICVKYDEALIIIGGDLNARVGDQDLLPTEFFDESNLYETIISTDPLVNRRGSLIAEFMGANAFLLFNGRTASDRPARSAFFSRTGKSVIDLVWVSVTGLRWIKDLRVMLEPTLSDHFPVELRLWNDIPRENQTLEGSEPPPIPHSGLKWSEDKRQSYYNSLLASARITNTTLHATAITMNENLTKAILEAADTADMAHTISNNIKTNKSKPCFDNNCLILKKELRDATRDIGHPDHSIKTKIKYLECRKKYQGALATSKKQYTQRIKNSFANLNSPSDFWEAVKKCKQKPNSMLFLPIERWNEFHANLTFYGPGYPILDKEISISELETALRKAKRGKAPGLGKIANEFLKTRPPNAQQYLLNLYNEILRNESIPPAWAAVSLTVIFKKGDRENPGNYRGIALPNNITKIFTSILRDRLNKLVKRLEIIPESQMGLRKGSSCVDSIFTLTTAIQLQ